MIVQDFVAGYARLHVLVDVEAVVAVLVKVLVLEDVQGAAGAALVVVLEVVILAVQVLAKEDVQEVVLVLVLLVLTVVLITVQVVAAHCARGVARAVQVDVQEHVKDLALVSVKDVQEVAQVIVVANVQGAAEVAVQEDAEDPVQLVFIVAPLVQGIDH